MKNLELSFAIPKSFVARIQNWVERYMVVLLVLALSVLSVSMFRYYYQNGLGLAYNDARSHLDIGRRVVEGLKPGIAQLGSVWLPLPHILMIPTIWNDFMWHSGLSGALQSMISYVATAILVYKILERLRVGMVGRLAGVFIFATNLNIVYLQSTAMTELLLIATMTAASYELIKYHEDNSVLTLIKCAFWVMLSTLNRYDGWFLAFVAVVLITIHLWRQRKFQESEGTFFLFNTLAGFGIFLWVLWNALIFKDPLYFALGPYSAHAQQEQIDAAGQLITKHNWVQSLESYWYAMAYNSNAFFVFLGIAGVIVLFLDKRIPLSLRLATTVLLAPFVFNVLALYFGHSVLFIQGINGDTWFNVRYGIMMVPSIAVLIGYLVHRLKGARFVLIAMICFITFFAAANKDVVTIDDGRVGSSQKNVSQVAKWLEQNAKDAPGFVLISAASHDAIIFSSQLPMKKFIHEGTGTYWLSATTSPDRWARWIVMRTNDENDQTFRLIKQSGQLYKYDLVDSYPFADIYQLKELYIQNLITEPVLPKQK